MTVGPSPAQISDINAAVACAQNSGVPTVSVLAGTYSAVTVTGFQTVTIAGPTATAISDNQVVISSTNSAGTISFGTSNSKGLTLRSLNLMNTATTGGVGPAIGAKGSNLGIYTCAMMSSAQGVFTASYGTAIIANSLISGTDKLFYNYPTVYVFQSSISVSASGASIFYGKGSNIGGTNCKATVVIDSSSVQGNMRTLQLPVAPQVC